MNEKLSDVNIYQICSDELGCDCGTCPYDDTDTCFLNREELEEDL